MNTLLRRLWSALCVTLLMSTGAAQAQVTRPEIAAKSFLLMDVSSNQVLTENNADAQVEPPR